MRPRAKRHHSAPAQFLRRFANAAGKLTVVRKEAELVLPPSAGPGECTKR